MHFLRNKYLVVTVLIIIFFTAGAYLQLANPPWFAGVKNNISHFWKNPSYLNKIDISGYKKPNLTPQPKIVRQKKFTIKEYTGMHISFTFPQNITYKQVNKQLVSLFNPSKKGDDNTIYIYSATVPADIDNFKIPFTIPGPMTHSSMIKLRGFIANQETYGSGANEVNLLVLRKKNQTIVLRIPKNSKPLDQTINQVINSLQILQ